MIYGVIATLYVCGVPLRLLAATYAKTFQPKTGLRSIPYPSRRISVLGRLP